MNSIVLLLLLPLSGFLLNGLFGRRLPESVSGWLSSVLVLGSFGLSLGLFIPFLNESAKPLSVQLFDWIAFADIKIGFGFYLDQLSALWLLVITGIGFLIHVYSISYMHGDEGFSRFFAYLNLFVFFMLVLVLGSNMLMTFIGWEGVGLCSYLLIGFWFSNQDYNDAAKKAFVMNRIGDLGFLLAMFYLLFNFGTLEYSELQTQIAGGATLLYGSWTIISLFVFIAATGKSAQLPLYTWLPDAMAGPTPVSALIHAATMVTAGIYLLVRTHFLFDLSPLTLQIVAWTGASTALFAALIGVWQNDIKKVLAYSTVSQLGLMFLALGCGAYTTAVFHVITHAFFKACLFLGSGSVIHALHGEQDIRNMGGLKKKMPVTHMTFLISSLAIAGIPPLSGFFSKDEILAGVFEHSVVLWSIASLASLLTAFYMFRLVFLTFYGEFRGTEEQKHHLHESPSLITLPLIVLAILASVGGAMGLPEFIGTHWLKHFLAPVTGAPAHAHHAALQTELMLIGAAVALGVTGIFLAWSQFKPGAKIPGSDDSLSGFPRLANRKFMVDELYSATIVNPLLLIARQAYTFVDRLLIDGLVEFSGKATGLGAQYLRKLQTGYIGFYLLVMVVCIALTFLFFFMV